MCFAFGFLGENLEILQESKLSFLDMVSQLTFKKLGQLIASCGRTRIDVYS